MDDQPPSCRLHRSLLVQPSVADDSVRLRSGLCSVIRARHSKRLRTWLREFWRDRLNVDPSAKTDTMLLSVKTVAAALSVPLSAMYEMIRAGKIDHVQVEACRYVSRRQLERFIESNAYAG